MTRSVEEWIGKDDDHSVPARVRLRVFDKFNGSCAICTRRIGGSLRATYDHIVALINGGENRERNLQLLCLPCHQEKTGSDVTIKSRIAARAKSHAGIKKPRTIRSWRRFDGTPVHASRER